MLAPTERPHFVGHLLARNGGLRKGNKIFPITALLVAAEVNQRPLLTCYPLPREPTYDAEFQHFLRGKEIVLSAGSTPKIQGLTVEQAEAVVRLSCLPAFKDLIAKVQADEVSILNASRPLPRNLAVRDFVCRTHGSHLIHSSQFLCLQKRALLTATLCLVPTAIWHLVGQQLPGADGPVPLE